MTTYYDCCRISVSYYRYISKLAAKILKQRLVLRIWIRHKDPVPFFYIDADPDPVLPFKLDVKTFTWVRDTVLFTFYN
jgi:hypothetical protein